MRTRIFINGRIFTSDDENPQAESFITCNGEIRWIGREEDRPETDGEITDLKGKCVIPGLVDSHMHPIILADCMGKISCLPPEVNSIEELTQAIRREAMTTPPGEWVRGWGYDEEKFAEHRAPTRWDLDKGSEDHLSLIHISEPTRH